ncbi:MAG: hypothetical protein HKN58_00980 [Xanthomonadales bacterium]|nr:hypothetical protein [Xanthomonadales bacterium]
MTKMMLTLLLASLSGGVVAQPMAYSVNSDEPLGDTLHQLNLATGSATAIGTGVSAFGVVRKDIEGLAIASDLSLWGIDESFPMSLFRINTTNGTVIQESDRSVSGLDSSESNDFGLTFTCDGTLYASSVVSQSLFTLSEEGVATRVGNAGSLGVNISAIASYGANPVRLFGLGNGLLGDEGPADNRSLYEIDPATGTTTLIGEIGPTVADYSQAGLSFDAEGNLWAITDRSQTGQFSQIIRLDIETGAGTVIANTTVMGFESLAIGPPGGCSPVQPQPPFQDTKPIPTLGTLGHWLAFLALMITGLIATRQRLA